MVASDDPHAVASVDVRRSEEHITDDWNIITAESCTVTECVESVHGHRGRIGIYYYLILSYGGVCGA